MAGDNTVFARGSIENGVILWEMKQQDRTTG